MKRIYNKFVGLLIVMALIGVGCSSEDADTSQSEEQESSQSDEQVVQNQEEEEETEEESQNQSEVADGEVQSKVLLDMMNAEEYTTEIEMVTKSGQNESESFVTTVVSGDKVYSSIESDSLLSKFVEKDDKFYQIMDDSETIIVSDRYEEEGEIDVSSQNLVYDDLEYLGEGTEEFLGNQRPYEEYSTELGSVKYYFDGDRLDGMEVLIDREKLLGDEFDDEDPAGMIDEESSIQMKILSFEKEADSSLFELPEDYEMVGE